MWWIEALLLETQLYLTNIYTVHIQLIVCISPDLNNF